MRGPLWVHLSAAFESVGTRSDTREQISFGTCCSWIPHAAAGDAAYISASPLQRPGFEDQASQFDHDASAALAFRLLRSPIAVSEYVEELWRLLNRKRPCQMQFAHPRNASRSSSSSMSCMSHLSREVFHWVMYVRQSNETAQPRSLRFINKFICITWLGLFHLKRCHTLRSSTVKFTQLLAWLMLDQKTT